MKKKSLLIFGDSWGRGAWTLPDGTYLYETQGDNYFTESFEKHFTTVENFSRGGASNNNILIFLKERLESESIQSLKEQNTSILVIQTEAMRTVIPQINFDSVDFYYSIFNKVDYKTFCEALIDFFYFNLNEIAKKYRIRINVTGGCSDIDTTLLKKYPYLNLCCTSFYGLVYEKHIPTIFSVTHDISKAIRKLNTANNYVISSIEYKQGIQSEYQGTMFGYALDNHPSRAGIDRWVSHIMTNIK